MAPDALFIISYDVNQTQLKSEPHFSPSEPENDNEDVHRSIFQLRERNLKKVIFLYF